MSQGQAYLNGQWVGAGALTLSVDDLGFTLGATVVERLRTFRGEPYRLDDHLARLRNSLGLVGWDAGRVTDEVGAAIRKFTARNAPLMAPRDDWTITAFVTPGLTPDAAAPTVCVHGGPLAFSEWAELFESGVELSTVDVRQAPPQTLPPAMKCRSRMHYYLADREAQRRRPGSRALLLDIRGFVGEAPTANVVAYFIGRGLVTPRIEAVLPGVSQQALFELAAKFGTPHQDADLTLEQLASADEVFLTSTSVCLLPVVRLDGQPIGNGSAGPFYHKLLVKWGETVGVDIAGQAREFAERSFEK